MPPIHARIDLLVILFDYAARPDRAENGRHQEGKQGRGATEIERLRPESTVTQAGGASRPAVRRIRSELDDLRFMLLELGCARVSIYSAICGLYAARNASPTGLPS